MGGVLNEAKKGMSALYDPLNISGTGGLKGAGIDLGIGFGGQKQPQGIGAGGPRPQMPGWESMIAGGGMLRPEYQLQAGETPGSIAEIEQRAMGEGPSDWLKLQLQGQQAGQAQARDQLGQQQAGATAEAQSQLAMRGGLRSGARERLAQAGSESRMMGLQDLASAGRGERLGLQQADEQMKTNLLTQLPQLQAAERQYQTGINEYNIGQALQEQQAKRAADLAKYSEQMKGYGAERSAQAMAAGGGGGKKGGGK